MKMKAGFLFADVPRHRASVCLGVTAWIITQCCFFTLCACFLLPHQWPHEDPKIKKKQKMPNGKSKTAQGASWFCSDAFTLISDGVTGAGRSQLAAGSQLRCYLETSFPWPFHSGADMFAHRRLQWQVFWASRRETRLLRPSPPHLHAEAKLKEKETEIEGPVGNIYFINHWVHPKPPPWNFKLTSWTQQIGRMSFSLCTEATRQKHTSWLSVRRCLEMTDPAGLLTPLSSHLSLGFVPVRHRNIVAAIMSGARAELMFANSTRRILTNGNGKRDDGLRGKKTFNG